MLMTEVEAKKKICGPSMAGAMQMNPIHAEVDFYPAHCIASDCMAWRQAQKRLTLPSTESPGRAQDGWVSSPVQPFDDGDGTHRLWENDRAGFCGLAGTP